MAQVKVGINGFGRIGRLTFRVLVNKPNVEVVAINDLTDTATLAHLLKYDSTQGKFKGTVDHDKENIIVNGKKIRVYAEKDPKLLPWGAIGVSVVLKSTGRFTDDVSAGQHITAGAKKVVISAPATGNVPTIVLGVNDNILTGTETILSNASCTTNCLAPLAKVLDDNFGLEKGLITTIHAYTNDQNILDLPHKDLRRARAAALSVIPTSTGAAKAIGLVLPHLKGKLDGYSLRVPVPTGSITDLVAIVRKPTTKEEVNAAFKKAADNELKGILEYVTDPIVSIDIVGNTHSTILDSQLTMVTDGTFIKVFGWYDNEAGYSNRAADLIARIA